MRDLRYVLFDLDGTIWESGPGITRSVQYALRFVGIEEPDLDNLTSFIGPPLNIEFSRRFHLNAEQTELAIRKFRERYDDQGVYECELYPGVRSMLEMVKDAGLILAASSGKPQPLVDRLMEHFGIQDAFRMMVGGRYEDELTNKTGVDNKQRIIKETLRRLSEQDGLSGGPGELSLAAGQAVMVGDTKYDVIGALRNDVHPIGAAYGYGGRKELEQAGAEDIAEDVPELTRMLLRMREGKELL
ncbi:MAG: HAD hydrolase-like protein [Eubacteriales bacterium]|nr:HAD hydrolase-like protein [Eubacteriales bacterium]